MIAIVDHSLFDAGIGKRKSIPITHREILLDKPVGREGVGAFN